MSAYTPADSQDGTSFIVSKTTDVAVINTFMINGAMNKMKATSTTTVVEFRGLTRQQAHDMADSADYNYTSKHGVKFTRAGGSYWMGVPECEGTECKADARRVNEADMHRVTVTYIDTAVTCQSGDSNTWTKDTF